MTEKHYYILHLRRNVPKILTTHNFMSLQNESFSELRLRNYAAFTSWIRIKFFIIEIKTFSVFDYIGKGNVYAGTGSTRKGLDVLLAEGPLEVQ